MVPLSRNEVNGKMIIQSIDTTTDTVYFHDADENIILEIDSYGYLSKNNRIIGKFNYVSKGNSNTWKYVAEDDSVEIEVNNSYIIECEEKVVVELIKSGKISLDK
jgi:hypothetical protein